MKFLTGILFLLPFALLGLTNEVRQWENNNMIYKGNEPETQFPPPPDPIQANPTISNTDEVSFIYFPDNEFDIPDLTIETGHLHGLGRANLSKHVQYKFIVPGFYETCSSSFSKRMIAAYRLRMDKEPKEKYQVICVDWRANSGVVRSDSTIQYFKWCDWLEFDARQKAPNVAALAVEFIHFLQKQDKIENFNQIHVIGFGIGSHIAGLIGEGLYFLENKRQLLGRITALDPPKASATKTYGDSTRPLKLQINDAKFVDVYHTDSSNHGTPEPLGHIDFFPNGGGISSEHQVDYDCKRYDIEVSSKVPLQPLWEKLVNLDFVKEQIHCRGQYTTKGICSHNLAYMFYAMSIVDPDLVAYKCEDYDQFKHAYCDKKTAPKVTFGEFIRPPTEDEYGNYYLKIEPQFRYKNLTFYDEINYS